MELCSFWPSPHTLHVCAHHGVMPLWPRPQSTNEECFLFVFCSVSVTNLCFVRVFVCVCVCRWCGRVAVWWWSCSLPWQRAVTSSVISTGPMRAPPSTTSTRYVRNSASVWWSVSGGEMNERSAQGVVSYKSLYLSISDCYYIYCDSYGRKKTTLTSREYLKSKHNQT